MSTTAPIDTIEQWPEMSLNFVTLTVAFVITEFCVCMFFLEFLRAFTISVSALCIQC